VLIIGSCKQPPSQKQHSITPTLEQTLQSGDIVCRYGDGIWSKQLRNVSTQEKRFSHVGIVILEADQLYVIHASANDYSGVGKVSKEPFAQFIQDTKDFAVYRLPESPQVRDQIAQNALTHIGKPFDMYFDLATEDKIYCSELVRICVNLATNKDLIKTSEFKGKEVVPIDNCYIQPTTIQIYSK